MRVLTRAELETAGEAIGQALPAGAVVVFEGDLGAGKTTFVQSIARGLGVREPATSPTHALVHHYQGRRGPVYHLDCFRLQHTDDAADLDWEQLLTEGDAVLIEWPEQVRAWLPTDTRGYRLHHVDDPDRRGLEPL